MNILTVICVASILLTISALANHIHGSAAMYHHGHDQGNDGRVEFDIKVHEGDSANGYMIKNNNGNDMGFDQFSQESNKDEAAKKHSKAASANKNHDKKLKKEHESKTAAKKAHDKAGASASAHNIEKTAEASKRHAKKYSRAKKINIYSKKASDITNSFEDNSASARSSSKDSAAQKSAVKDRGTKAAQSSNERELSLSDKGSSNAASREQANRARVQSSAGKNQKSGHKMSSSNSNHGHRRRSRPSSFSKLAAHRVYDQHGPGIQQPGSTGSYQAYTSGGISTSHAYILAGGNAATSLPSNSNGIGSRSLPGHSSTVGTISSLSMQNNPRYRPGNFGTADQPSGSNTFGSAGSMSYPGSGTSLGSMTNIGSTSQSNSMIGHSGGTSGLYVRPAIRAHESGLTLEKVDHKQTSSGYPRASGQKAMASSIQGYGSFASFDSEFFKGFDDDFGEDDKELFDFDYGSSGFVQEW